MKILISFIAGLTLALGIPFIAFAHDGHEGNSGLFNFSEFFENFESENMNHDDMDDHMTDNGEDEMHDGEEIGYDDIINTVEGHPFYGAIKTSLTVEGDTSAETALALKRFPVADSDGDFYYERTFTVSDDLIESLKAGEAVLVQHGIDFNDSGKYDGDLESALAEGVPLEATVPAACGTIEWHDGKGLYAELDPLNDEYSDAHSLVWVGIVSEEENRIKVSIDSNDFAPNLAHAQHFHVGGEHACPPESAADDSDRGEGSGGMHDEMNHDDMDDHMTDNGEDEMHDGEEDGMDENEIKNSLEEALEQIRMQIEELQERIDRLFA